MSIPAWLEAANDPQQKEQVITEPTNNLIPGNRLVTGRIVSIRANQIEIDIGNPQSLYVPLRAATVKGQTFKVG